MAKRPKREYSRDFTPRGDGRAFTIGRIPTALLTAAQAKAKREGKSLRAMFLRQLAEYVAAAEGIDRADI